MTQRKLKDGAEVMLRPIKPEDEPLWHELLAGCSTQSRWFRFNYLFKQTTHEMASRYCFIDYDRELAIVAEVEEEGQRKLIGIGRLVADVDHQTAEYAVIVVDRWQGRGLGGMLTDYCLELAKKWGVKQVVAEIAKDNGRMLATFRNRGFEIDFADGAGRGDGDAGVGAERSDAVNGDRKRVVAKFRYAISVNIVRISI